MNLYQATIRLKAYPHTILYEACYSTYTLAEQDVVLMTLCKLTKDVLGFDLHTDHLNMTTLEQLRTALQEQNCDCPYVPFLKQITIHHPAQVESHQRLLGELYQEHVRLYFEPEIPEWGYNPPAEEAEDAYAGRPYDTDDTQPPVKLRRF